jgi:hypothetical protein
VSPETTRNVTLISPGTSKRVTGFTIDPEVETPSEAPLVCAVTKKQTIRKHKAQTLSSLHVSRLPCAPNILIGITVYPFEHSSGETPCFIGDVSLDKGVLVKVP